MGNAFDFLHHIFPITFIDNLNIYLSITTKTGDLTSTLR